ncbi:riboflavin synthase [Paenibacillus lentus]|uniref:Riboflavin synthase n=1 Tax=Paenibacillus lentus TaxID=1338368 RepID=A0A3Q8SC11_9BACL|nr:riboflavin synthase [Paenibacillus lentus]AZK47130.1 riboflavin synthase [Paenibacillus lentus]
MFTGLVEEVGAIKSIQSKGEAMIIHINANVVTQGMKLGDSVAVNGVCLTATQFDRSSFTVDVMPQTFRNTNLSQLRSGSKVNLERAMAADGRFGGHIVQGHVDGVGTITGIKQDQNAVVFEITPAEKALFKYIIPKGSITIDGISLTVVAAEGNSFSVSIIPHTLAETVLAYKRQGDSVNLECDILGKYVEHLLVFGKSNTTKPAGTEVPSPGIDMPFLMKNGFA